MLHQKKLGYTALYFLCFILYVFLILTRTPVTGIALLDFWLSLIPSVISQAIVGLLPFIVTLVVSSFVVGVGIAFFSKQAQEQDSVTENISYAVKFIHQCNPFYDKYKWARLVIALLMPYVELFIVYPLSISPSVYFAGKAIVYKLKY